MVSTSAWFVYACQEGQRRPLLLLYYCFTTALLLLYLLVAHDFYGELQVAVS
jgi:hypothetical protein